MAKKPKVLSDDEIVTKVDAKSKNAVGWQNSKLSAERERVLAYYNGLLPKKQHQGASSYVSTDVYDAVESLKAQLLEVFSGGDHIAKFDPTTEMSADDCMVATEYASYIIFRQNPGFDIFQHTIHDGLTARVGIVKVFWEEKYEYSEETFEGLQHHEAMALAAQQEVDEFNADEDPATGTFSGELSRKIDCSKVAIINVPPEEFLISPRAVKMHDRSTYMEHRTKKTKSELIDMGYDEAVVNGLPDETQDIDFTPEAQERNAAIEAANTNDDPIQDKQGLVMYREAYAWMDIGEGTRLYKFCFVGQKLLDKEEIDRAPFLAYVPLPVPHIFFGNNYAARVIPFQNAQTVLTRAVLDHASTTTNPRWAVVKGGLSNPREMLENRLGGIVNVARPDSVAPLLYPNLNPFIFEVLGKLKDDKEQSTGISALSQGLNKDAISKQNAQGLVDQLVTLSSTRQKVAARNFAYNFFVPLMIEVIRLALVNAKKGKFADVAGQPMKIDAQRWAEKTTCTVSMHLGYGEKDQAINQLTTAYAGMAQDPSIAHFFTDQNKYNMITDIMKMRSWNHGRYITDPTKVPPPQPNPIPMIEAKAKDTAAQAAMITAQTKAQGLQIDAQDVGVKAQHGQQKLVLNAMQHDREQDRKDLDTANKIQIDNREMRLAEKTEKREAFIAPGN